MGLRLAGGGGVMKPGKETIPMSDTPSRAVETYCFGCVYHPPNLPSHAYATADWAMLKARACAFEHVPGTDDCLACRKTSCSLVDLDAVRQASAGPRE